MKPDLFGTSLNWKVIGFCTALDGAKYEDAILIAQMIKVSIGMTKGKR